MCKINGKKLEELRVQAGISKAELARELGVTGQTITNYENGKYAPSDENADKICMILKITKDDIEVHDVGYSFTNGESKTVQNVRQRKGFHRNMNPIELENWIESKRTENTEKRKTIIRSTLKNGSYTIGKKKFILIDPTFIHIPKWQRDTDMAKVEEIKQNFEEDKYEAIKVYLDDDGELYVADGAHRLVAIIMRNADLPEDERELILVEILSGNKFSAVITFLSQGSGRKNMSVGDTYRAGIKANVDEYIRFKNIFSDHNIQITAELEKLDNPIGKVTPSRNLLRLSKNKRDILEKSLDLIEELNWCGSDKNAFVLRTINTVIKLFAKYGYDETETKLMKNCKGATYYESKIFPIKSNSELYDMLATEIIK